MDTPQHLARIADLFCPIAALCAMADRPVTADTVVASGVAG
ncbi:hypothetical protein [Acrocarpospora phusangensis]|nr:hypothetical protein [Acrocarpospora phusangensis]